MPASSPSRRPLILPTRPNLNWLKNRARERVAIARKVVPSTKLTAAQLDVARDYGFSSWRALKSHIDSITAKDNNKLNKAMWQAVHQNDLAAVKGFVARGECSQHDLDYCLGRACLRFNERQAIARFLVDSGANPNGQYGVDYGPIIFAACECHDADGIEFLLRSGADVTFGPIETKYGPQSPMSHLTNSYARISNAGKHRAIDLLIRAGAKWTDDVFMTIHRGDCAALEQKLNDYPSLVYRRFPTLDIGNINLRGATLLHMAIDFNEPECAMVLYHRGADLNARAEPIDGVGNQTPIFHTIRTINDWQTPFLKLIIEHVGRKIDWSVSATFRHYEGTKGPMTPLEWVGDHPVERAMIEAVLPAPASAASSTATHEDAFLAAATAPAHAHRAGTLDEAKSLLKSHPEIKGSSIHVAAVTGDVKALSAFLKSDPGLATRAGGAKNWLPLIYLCFSRFLRIETKRSRDFVKCAKLLLDAGADPNSYFINDGDSEQERAIYGACGVANDPALTRLLLSRGADVNDTETLYHVAENADHTCLKLILKAKPKLDLLTYCMCHKMDFDDPAGVKLFLDHGADPNGILQASGMKGFRPLHFAIVRGRGPDTLRVLLDGGADPKLPSTTGVSAFQLASKLGQTANAKLLLEYGATDDLTGKDRLIAALASGDRRSAERERGRLSELTPQDYRALVDAADAGHLRAVKLMLDFGIPIESRGATGGGWVATALHHAAWKGHLGVVKLLLDRGASLTAQHSFGGDALGAAIHGASHAGHKNGLRVVELLARAMKSTDFKPYLDYAKEHPNQDVAAFLEKMVRAASDDPVVKALPAHRRTHKIAQWKPIMDAAFTGDAARVTRLISEGADPNIVSTTPSKYRPLHRAIEKKKSMKRAGLMETVQALLAGGADPTLRGHWDQLTALQLAAVQAVEFIAVLIDRFCPLDLFHACAVLDAGRLSFWLKKDRSLANANDVNGWSPLHYVAASARFAEPKMLDVQLAMARQLIDASAKVDATYFWNGEWPISVLYQACGRHDNPALTELFLQAGADPCDGESVYHAADEGHAECLKMIERYTDKKKLARECSMCLAHTLHWGHVRGAMWFLEHGADPNWLSPQYGTAAIHEAAIHRVNEKVMKALLDHGADLDLKNKAGQTARQLLKQKKGGRSR